MIQGQRDVLCEHEKAILSQIGVMYTCLLVTSPGRLPSLKRSPGVAKCRHPPGRQAALGNYSCRGKLGAGCTEQRCVYCNH